MEIIDTFKTIKSDATGEFKDKGSKFFAYAYHVTSEEQVKEQIKCIKKEFYDAGHHCYGFRIGSEKSLYRFSDDGEPSGTAGKPIYGQLLSYDLTDILIVVTRYFGGTKLGVSGLINAYRSTAKEAILNAEIIIQVLLNVYHIEFTYEQMNDIMRIQKEFNLTILNQDFSAKCSIDLGIRQSITERVLSKLSNLQFESKFINTIKWNY